MSTFSFNTLPQYDNVNKYSFSMEVTKEFFLRKGKMIAYYGDLKFEAFSPSLFQELEHASFNAMWAMPQFVIAKGLGKLIIGDDGLDIASMDLSEGNLTIKARHLLGFESSLTCEETFVPGYLTLHGTGKVLTSTNGPVHFMEAPVYTDPEATLGWADSPCPSFHYDFNYLSKFLSAAAASFIDLSSGEEKQMHFSGNGTILVQSSEKPIIEPPPKK